jgi:DNA-binding MarR family transcriptional regulator
MHYDLVMRTRTAVTAEDALARVSWTLRRADLAIQGAKEPGLREIQVPAAHYSLLMHVHVFPGLTGAELGRRLGVTTQAVALLATKLEAKGLLERRVHSRHRNIQELHLTEAGLEALNAADDVVLAVDRRVRQTLGPERSDQLRQLLDDILQEFGGQGSSDGTSDR